MTGSAEKVLYVFAGPNGSGKSTIEELYAEYTALGSTVIVNPDNIAKGLYGKCQNPAAEAGKLALRRRQELLREGASFGIETTFSGSSEKRLIAEAKSLGYTVKAIYVATESPEINVLRVMNRVRQGGHSVPPEDVRRRYAKSLASLGWLLQQADYAAVRDNTVWNRTFLRKKGGRVHAVSEDIPSWFLRSVDRGELQGRQTEA